MKKVVYASHVTLNPIDGAWYDGNIDGYHIQAKIFEEPSIFGIDSGRISKLWIKGNGELLNYDRGWDTPEPWSGRDDYSEELLSVYTDVIDNYN